MDLEGTDRGSLDKRALPESSDSSVWSRITLATLNHQEGAAHWLAPPCSRGRDDARNRGVRPRGSGGQALQVLSRAPGIPGHPTPGVAAPPPDRDATLLCEWRAEPMRGTEQEILGPSVRP